MSDDHVDNPFAKPNLTLQDIHQPPAEPTAPADPPVDKPSGPVRLRFTGDPAEYFKIWITNLLLTIITFGLYGPWAKVRREKYFRQNTYVGESNLDYHGDPKSILFGRLAAFGVFGLTYTGKFSVTFALVVAVFIALAVPWALRSSIKFRFHNTSYQGIRFGFDGTTAQAYLIALPLSLAAVAGAIVPNILETHAPGSVEKRWAGLIVLAFVFGLIYTPAFLALWRRFALNHGRYGTVRTSTSMTVGGYILQYLKVAALPLGVLVVGVAVLYFLVKVAGVFSKENLAGPVAILFTVLIVLFFYGMVLLAGPLIVARLHNYVWNKKTSIVDSNGATLAQFSSDLKARNYLKLQIKNVLLSGITFGLYRPIASMNNAKARIESVSISDLSFVDEVHAQKQSGNRAFGAEAVDVFDIDFSL